MKHNCYHETLKNETEFVVESISEWQAWTEESQEEEHFKRRVNADTPQVNLHNKNRGILSDSFYVISITLISNHIKLNKESIGVLFPLAKIKKSHWKSHPPWLSMLLCFRVKYIQEQYSVSKAPHKQSQLQNSYGHFLW